MPNSSVISSLNSSVSNAPSAIEGIDAAAPILQGLMEGLGWHDERVAIQARDEAAALIMGNLRQAAADYDAEPTPAHRAVLTAALEQELITLRAEHDYAKAQQRHYVVEVECEAKARASRSSGWGEWAISGVKSFFGSMAEQQVEKYAEMVMVRQTKIEQLQGVLASLNEVAFDQEASAPASPEVLAAAVVADAPSLPVRAHHPIQALLVQVPIEAQFIREEKSLALESAEPDEDVIELDTRDGERIPAQGRDHHAHRLLLYPLSDEFQVNTYTTNIQFYPSIAVLFKFYC